MNKYLLAGCAAAALTLGSGIAAAQDFKVTLSGEAKFQAMGASQDKNNGTRSVDFRNRFRFTVNPEATAFNNALTYGARVLVKNENNGTTSFEAAYLYGQGAFGKVYLGTVTSFNDDNGGVTRPADFLTEDDGMLGFVAASAATDATGTRLYNGNTGTLNAWRWKTVALGDQASKIRYDSPFIYGLKLGLAYTPSSSGSLDAWDWNRDKVRAFTDIFEAGLLFNSTDVTVADKFGAAVVKASIDYQTAKNGNPVVAGVGYEDWNAYQAGLNVGYAGFTVGGHYVYLGKSGLYKADVQQNKAYSYGVGAQYVTGPWKVGLGYNYSEADAQVFQVAGSGDGKKSTAQFTTGVMYNVAKGLDVGLNYSYVKTKNTNTTLATSDNASIVGADVIIGF